MHRCIAQVQERISQEGEGKLLYELAIEQRREGEKEAASRNVQTIARRTWETWRSWPPLRRKEKQERRKKENAWDEEGEGEILMSDQKKERGDQRTDPLFMVACVHTTDYW